MTITGITQYLYNGAKKPMHLVRVDTNEGIFGVGEATLDEKILEVSNVVNDLKEELCGTSVFDIEKWFCRFFTNDPGRGGMIQAAAVSGIETACWDAIGQKTKQPIYNLMGGKLHDEIALCASGWHNSCETIEEHVEAALDVVKQGFWAIKLAPITPRLMEKIQTRRIMLPEIIEMVKAVRSAIGDRVELYLDFMEKLDFDQAMWVCKQLECEKIEYVQDPVHHYDFDGYFKLTQTSNIPLAAGRGLYGRAEYKRLFESVNCSTIQPDPILCGGILETKKIFALSEASFMKVSATNSGGPISLVAGAHISATIPHYLRQEIDICNLKIDKELFGGALNIKDGMLKLNRLAYGLGLTPNFESLFVINKCEFNS